MNINEEIKKSMFTQDRARLNVLRGLKNALSNASLQAGNINKELSQTEFVNVVRKQIKQRNESAALFSKGGRQELVEKEISEVKILEEFLPLPLTDAEIDSIVEKAINRVQATGKVQMGTVIKVANELAEGQVDGKTLSTKISTIFR